jgi:hypothetical protein
MLSHPHYLELCHELWKKGLSYDLRPGLRIGRGFSDIGAEEYSVLNNKKAVSLLTGKEIELDEFFLNYYFFVPDAEELVLELFKRNINIEKIEFIDQRSWRIEIENQKMQKFIQEERSLHQCLALLLLDHLKS